MLSKQGDYRWFRFSGQLIWTWEGNAGVTDNASPHIVPLVGAESGAGSHTGVLTNAPPLVQAAAYTIQLMGVDGAGNADTVMVANVTYDTLAPGIGGATVYDGDSLLFDFDSTQVVSMILANYSGFSEPTSGIVLYEYAVGSTAGGTDVLDWTANGTDTSITASDLQLAFKILYYVTVRATDGAGNVSDSVSSDGVRIIAKPRLTTSIIQNSALGNYLQIFVNDTLGMADSIRVVAGGITVKNTIIDSTTYVANLKILEVGALELLVTGFSASGDTTLADSVTIALARTAQHWVATSADRRFRVEGQSGAVNEDRYFLVVDSTLFLPSENSRGAYRIGDGQFSFAAPVRVSMRPSLNGLAKGIAPRAIYALGPDGGWEELPTVDDGEFVTTWASQTGIFRLGRRTIIVPQTTSLHQNYPNPFNPITRIVFDLGFLDGPRQQATVEIYNLLGQRVITLFDGEATTGRYEMVWRGTDAKGVNVASGVYFIRLVTGSGYHVTKKMLLVR
ncbi:MAG: T9SS type A sorting domain-containing protein [Candidatus Marinimicrobia bacterium]|nr:T9SS type A sorting domain-containing protein [Candidatus Neomarinimicrobiota bacterium]